MGSWLPPIEREAEGGTAPGKDGDSGDGSRRIRGRTSRRHRARPGKNGIAATDEADEGVEVATSEAGEDAVTATGRAETAPVHLAGSEEERGGGNWRGRGRHRATTGRPETTDLTGFREERGGFLGKEDGAGSPGSPREGSPDPPRAIPAAAAGMRAPSTWAARAGLGQEE